MVLRAKRCAELMCLLSGQRIEPKRIRPVYPSPDHAASVVLVQAARSAGRGTILESPLLIKDSRGEYTRELLEAYSIRDPECP